MNILHDADHLAEPIFDFKLNEEKAIEKCLVLLNILSNNLWKYDNGLISKDEFQNEKIGHELELDDLVAYMNHLGWNNIPDNPKHTYACEAVRRRQDAIIDSRTSAQLEELRGKWSLLDEMKEEDLILERSRVTGEITTDVYFQKKEELLERFMPVYNFCIAAECVDMVKLAGM